MQRPIAFVTPLRIICLVLLVLSCGLSASAQRDRDRDRDYYDDGDRDRGRYHGRWEVLGSSNVDGRRDHDRIVVNAPGGFRALQLGIKGGEIEFSRVLVHFENGADHDLPVRYRIRAGGKTRVMDLPGDRRRIRSVEFWYGRPNWDRNRPRVNLWGLR